jgi:fluoroacetyl-CoA thioesterase
MKEVYKVGDALKTEYLVTPVDVAAFKGEIVHNVCSTFVLAREIEWSSRQFVLAIKDEDEEGIGTQLTIDHKSAAFIGELIEIEAIILKLEGNELTCSYKAKVGERIIATGKTGQKVLKKTAINEIFSKFGQDE